jgi:predicted nucleic acid-binding protein
MEQNYLVDTNIIIYYLKDSIPQEQLIHVNNIFTHSFHISSITKIELLGWHRIDENQRTQIAEFLSKATVFYVDEEIERITIRLKQEKKMPIADAIIAATALLHKLILVTRNEADFQHIPELTVFNPFSEKA